MTLNGHVADGHDERCATCFERVPPGGTCDRRVCQVDEADRAPSDLSVGAELHGHFLIGRVLGRGGFGITYLAWDQRLARRVAVKECYPFGLVQRGRDATTVVAVNETARRQFALGREMFLREARLVAQFHDHPGVVSVLWVFEEHETAYMVMEFLQGQTLKDLLEEEPGERLSYERALQLTKPAMEALQAVHEDGLLHRDISPDNLFLPKRGGVKLLDFGAARYTLGQQTRSLPVILKEGYAPLEQYYAKGNQGPWTDVYAMAATVYRAVTGTTPPPVLERLEADELAPPSALGVDLPASAEQALLKALTVKADARTRSVSELLTELSTPDPAPRQEPRPSVPAATGITSPIDPKRGDRPSRSRPRRRTSAAALEIVTAVAVAEPVDEDDEFEASGDEDYRQVDSDRPTRTTISPPMRAFAGAIVLTFLATLIWIFTELLK